MGLVKITFDGSSVNSKQDAEINHHLAGSMPEGVIKGIGGELAVTASNNYIYFRSGYVQIYGRRIYVEENTSIYVSLDSNKYGYVIIQLNLNSDSVTLSKVETSSTYPTLTHQNLLNGGTTYQMAIAKYSKTTTSLTIQPYEIPAIDSALTIARDAQTKANAITFRRREAWARTYTDDFDTLSSVTLDLSAFPYECLLVFTFETDDPWAYGAMINVMGSYVLNHLNIWWNTNKFVIRNNDNTGDIKVTITGNSSGRSVTVSFDTTNKLPSVVKVTGYYVG